MLMWFGVMSHDVEAVVAAHPSCDVKDGVGCRAPATHARQLVWNKCVQCAYSTYGGGPTYGVGLVVTLQH